LWRPWYWCFNLHKDLYGVADVSQTVSYWTERYHCRRTCVFSRIWGGKQCEIICNKRELLKTEKKNKDLPEKRGLRNIIAVNSSSVRHVFDL
jgi:hypothetical protein